MSQPQAPFGVPAPRWEAGPDGVARWVGAPLREMCETLDTAGVLKRQAAQIGELQVRVVTLAEANAALDDQVRRLRERLEAHLESQAL